MAHIGLISCVSQKLPQATAAKDLYVSALFKKSREYVEQQCDSWFILSARYGLVEPTEIIDPYEESLNTKSCAERAIWCEMVWAKLQIHIKPGDSITILAGERYREQLIPLMIEHGCDVKVPLKGLGIGRQLQWLTNQREQMCRVHDVERFYQALHRLEVGIGGKRVLRECRGDQNWPKSGVYLFMEDGELRSSSGQQRVVRVGTHGVSRGSKATLWNRLRTHRGTLKLLGNHRGSIFRLHVGAALTTKYCELSISSWGVGQSSDASTRKAEERLEHRVSEYIGAMQVLWLAVEDEASATSDRAYIERNLIGLIFGKSGPADPPSAEWLGRFSPNEQIQKSGLWNLDHLCYPYSPDFLDVLDEYVLITSGKLPKPTNSIAPSNWYKKGNRKVHPNQLDLF